MISSPGNRPRRYSAMRVKQGANSAAKPGAASTVPTITPTNAQKISALDLESLRFGIGRRTVLKFRGLRNPRTAGAARWAAPGAGSHDRRLVAQRPVAVRGRPDPVGDLRRVVADLLDRRAQALELGAELVD